MTIKAIIPTCDNYVWLMNGFFHQWQKHCGLPGMVVCEYKVPRVPGNWSFVRAGYQTEVKHWTGNLLVALEQIYDDTVLLLLEDYWLTYADMKRLRQLELLMKDDRSIDKIDLTNDRLGFGHVNYSADFVRSTQDAEYLTSVQTAIWRTSFLCECLHNPSWNPWQFEVEGSKRAKLFTHKVLGCKVPVMANANIVLKGIISQSDINKFSEQERQELTDIGAFNKE